MERRQNAYALFVAVQSLRR